MTINTNLTINGSDFNSYKSLRVNRSISENNASSDFDMEVDNPFGQRKSQFNIGDEIIIYADKDVSPVTKIFTGIVEDISFNGEGVSESINVGGRDFTARLMDRTVEPEVYTNLQAGSIVKDIVNKYVNNISTSGVTITGSAIDRISYNHKPVYDAIKQLADLKNMTFYVDVNKDLHFEALGSSISSYILDNSNVLEGTFRNQRDTIFNKIWVYGDRYLDGFREVLNNSGGSVFTLLYNPHNTEIFKLGSQVQPGAIWQMTTSVGSNIKYFVNYDDKQIIFTSGTSQGDNIPISGGSTLFIYKRLLPIVKVGDDEPSKQQYGERIKVIVDKDIKDPKTAEAIMKNELIKYSQPELQGDLTINGIIDILPGQDIQVNLPNHNINNQVYNVIEANYNFVPETIRSDQVLGIRLNKKIPDFTDKIKDIMLQLKKIQSQDISDADTITRYQSTTGSIGVRESGLYVRLNTLTTSGLRCYWNGGDTSLCGTLASGTLQKTLFGGENGSPTTAWTINWSGGF